MTALATAPVQGTPEWLDWRLGGYGASEAPILVAGDQEAWWRLHARKLRLVDAEDLVEQTATMRWGLLLEPAIADAYTEATGHRVIRVNRPLAHAERAHVRASLDRRRHRGRVVVELKKWGWPTDDFGPGCPACLTGLGAHAEATEADVPANWIDQIQQQLYVTGYDHVDVAVLFAGGSGRDPFRVYHFGRDQARIDALLALEDAAWAYVARGEMPPWPGPAPTRLRLRDGELEADAELSALLERGHQARVNKQQAERADKELTAEILERIGDAGVVRGAAVDVTAKPNKDGEKVAWELIAKAYRKWLETLLHSSLSETEGLERLASIESTFTTTTPGARPLRYVPHQEEIDADR